jgi:hypothetical protein
MTAEPRYVIGLDIGDGESCLAWGPLDRSESTQIYTRPRSGERNIVTAMAQAPVSADRRRLIGDEAVISRGATHFSVNFKAAPHAFSIETPDAVIFAQTLLTEFREHHPDVFQDAIAFVGHPAGWSAEAVDAYGRHLDLLDLPVRLMPESQSALLHVRDRGPDEKHLDRVLVVDIGSSTTDFTIVEDLTPKNLPVNTALGCRQIDEQLADLVRTEWCDQPELMEVLSAEGGQEFLLLACRWIKEAQFSGRPRRLMDLRESCDKRLGPVVDAAVWLDGFEIPQMVGGPGGWGENFRAILTEIADLLGDRRPPHLVILTGGGSRMPLTGRLCREVFPTAAVERDQDPAFAVACGLVSNGQHWANVARFRRDMTELAQAPQTKERVRTEAEAALDTMKERVAVQVLEARRTAANLAKHIRLGVFEATLALNDSLDYYLSMRVKKICRCYGIPYQHESLKLTPPNLFEHQLNRILERANKIERLANPEHTIPMTVQNFLGSLVNPVTRKLRLAAAPQIASAIGVVASSSGLGVDRAARAALQRMLHLGEYTPEQLDQVTSEVMETITKQTNELAHQLERWLA